MQYFLEIFDLLKNNITGKNVFLFLDYDGTLAPIADHPRQAVLSRATKSLLRMLSENPRYKVFIVSGRALQDVKAMVGLDHIGYVGNHGLEMDLPEFVFDYSGFSKSRGILEYLRGEINKELMFFKGAFVEDKGFGLSVHYRRLDPDQFEMFNLFLTEVIKPFLSRNEIHFTKGKKVFEIRLPVDWDKGKAVRWLIEKYKHYLRWQTVLPIYIGDDMTDEDAFKVLKNEAITVKVGIDEISSANYFLKKQDEVDVILEGFVHPKD